MGQGDGDEQTECDPAEQGLDTDEQLELARGVPGAVWRRAPMR